MLQLELEEAWSDQNYLRFKRVRCRRADLPELLKRKEGMTNWPDESIIMQGMFPIFYNLPSIRINYFILNCWDLGINIIKRGPPFKARRWHLFWQDHQSFVEELAYKLIHYSKPAIIPVRILVYQAPDVSKTWDQKGPPMGTSRRNPI